MWVFEDETIVMQKPCIRKSMSFEGEQQKIRHNGIRKKFSIYISMLWPNQQQKLLYDFYDRMDSTNTINHLENLKMLVMKNGWKRIVMVQDNASFNISKMARKNINAQRDWLTVIRFPKRAPYLNPNERKVNHKIKSDVCANRFYINIDEQKDAVSEYLDRRFGKWYNDIYDDN